MTVGTFFANFGHLADAPNGVQKLRELILQLAVQGKLVPQDPEDEPALELLEKIREEKGVKSHTVPIENIDKSYDLPENWEWVRFGSIAHHNAGKTLDKGRNTGHLRDYITTSNLYWGYFDLNNVRQMPIQDNELERCTARKGDLLICEGGEAGRAAVWNQDKEVCFQNHVHRARLLGGIDPFYAYRVFEKLNASGEIEQYRKGVGISNMSGKALASIPFPLPPLEEQKRIVAKVDQLMTLCGELEARQKKQQQGRVRLNNAALDALFTAREPDEFADHWQRISSNFDLLYDHPETIAKLRAAILQLAVKGELVPQDPNDEPASVLLERIETEKERLVREKKGKKGKVVASIDSALLPWGLPDGWQWIRFGELALDLRYGTSKRCDYKIKGDPVLRIPNLVNGALDVEDLKFTHLTDKEKINLSLQKGDLLLIRSNGSETLVGRSAVVGSGLRGFSYAGYLVRVRTLPDRVIPKYVHFMLESDFVRSQIEGPIRTTSGVKNINSTEISNLLISLPPHEEQKRIVAKVDQLMALCDELEGKLKQAQQHSQKLMEATVRQLLGPSAPQKPHTARVSTAPAVSESVHQTRHAYQPAPATDDPLAAEASADYSGSIPDIILTAMQPGQEYSRAEILAASGLRETDWIWAIRQLKEQGRVVQKGERRGARYSRV